MGGSCGPTGSTAGWGGPGGGFSAPVSEPPAVIAGLDDVAVMSDAVEQRGGHLRIAEHGRPFAERQVRGDDHRGALVELADEVELRDIGAGANQRAAA